MSREAEVNATLTALLAQRRRQAECVLVGDDEGIDGAGGPVPTLGDIIAPNAGVLDVLSDTAHNVFDIYTQLGGGTAAFPSTCKEYEQGRLAADCLLIAAHGVSLESSPDPFIWPQTFDALREIFEALSIDLDLKNQGGHFDGIEARIQLTALQAAVGTPQVENNNLPWKSLNLPWVELALKHRGRMDRLDQNMVAKSFVETFGPKSLGRALMHMGLLGEGSPPGLEMDTEMIVRGLVVDTVLEVFGQTDYGVLQLCLGDRECLSVLCVCLQAVGACDSNSAAQVLADPMMRALMTAGEDVHVMTLLGKLAGSEENAGAVHVLLQSRGMWAQVVATCLRQDPGHPLVELVANVVRANQTAALSLVRSHWSQITRAVGESVGHTGPLAVWKVLAALATWQSGCPEAMGVLVSAAGRVSAGSPELCDLLVSLLSHRHIVTAIAPHSPVARMVDVCIATMVSLPLDTDAASSQRDAELRLVGLRLAMTCLEGAEGHLPDMEGGLPYLAMRVLGQLLDGGDERALLRQVLAAVHAADPMDMQDSIHKTRSSLFFNRSAHTYWADLELCTHHALRILSLAMDTQSAVLHTHSTLLPVTELLAHTVVEMPGDVFINHVPAIAQFVAYQENKALAHEALTIITSLAHMGDYLRHQLSESEGARESLTDGLAACLALVGSQPPSLDEMAASYFGSCVYPGGAPYVSDLQALAVNLLVFCVRDAPSKPNIGHVLLGYADALGAQYTALPYDFPRLLQTVLDLLAAGLEANPGSLGLDRPLVGAQLGELLHALLVSRYTCDVTVDTLTGPYKNLLPLLLTAVQAMGAPQSSALTEADVHRVALQAWILKVCAVLLHVYGADTLPDPSTTRQQCTDRLLRLLMLPPPQARAFATDANVPTKSLIVQLLDSCSFPSTGSGVDDSNVMRTVRTWVQAVRQVVEIVVTCHPLDACPHALWDRMYRLAKEQPGANSDPSFTQIDTLLDIAHGCVRALKRTQDGNIRAQLARVVFTIAGNIRLKAVVEGYGSTDSSRHTAPIEVYRAQLEDEGGLSGLHDKLVGLLAAVVAAAVGDGMQQVVRCRLYGATLSCLRLCGALAVHDQAAASNANTINADSWLMHLAASCRNAFNSHGRTLIDKACFDAIGGRKGGGEVEGLQAVAYGLLDACVVAGRPDVRAALLSRYVKGIVESMAADDQSLTQLAEGTSTEGSTRLPVHELRMALLTRLALTREGAEYLVVHAGVLQQLAHSQCLQVPTTTDPMDLITPALTPTPSTTVRRLQLCALRLVSAINTTLGLDCTIQLRQMDDLLATKAHVLVYCLKEGSLQMQVLSSGLFSYYTRHGKPDTAIRDTLSDLLAKHTHVLRQPPTDTGTPQREGSLQLCANILIYARGLYHTGYKGLLFDLPDDPGAPGPRATLWTVLDLCTQLVQDLNAALMRLAEPSLPPCDRPQLLKKAHMLIGMLRDGLCVVEAHVTVHSYNPPAQRVATALHACLSQLCAQAAQVLQVDIPRDNDSMLRLHTDMRGLWADRVRPLEDLNTDRGWAAVAAPPQRRMLE